MATSLFRYVWVWAAGGAIAIWLLLALRPRHDIGAQNSPARGEPSAFDVRPISRPPSGADPQVTRTGPPAHPDVVELTPPADSTAFDADARKRFRDRMDEAQAQYAESSVYPPWSRPYDDAQQLELRWNQAQRDGQDVATDAEGHKIKAELALDRQFVGPGETATAEVRVWREGGGAIAAPGLSVRGELRQYDPAAVATSTSRYAPGWQVVANVTLTPRPEDPTRFVGSFRPDLARGAGKGSGAAELVAWVYAEGNAIPLSLPLGFAVTRPITVLGVADDSIAAGSLEVGLTIRSEVAGRTRIAAVLTSHDDTPIAVYTTYADVEVGEQRLPLTFFGKAIRERKLDGPYKVVAIHGHVDQNGHGLAWKYDGALATSRYAASSFSDADWNDPERSARLEIYERAIAGASPEPQP